MPHVCLVALFAFLCSAGPVVAAPDFSSGAGAEASCADPARLQAARTPQELQALVICRDIDLVRRVLTFATQGLDRLEKEKPTNRQISAVLRQELLAVRDELRSTRAVLEKIDLRGGAGLLLAPATWGRDLNGDGKLAVWERYFFAIPKQQDGPLVFRMASDNPDYYRDEYRLDASFKVDQSDVVWALGYHYFGEALVELALAYALEGETVEADSFVLADPDSAGRARALLLAGFKSTERLRGLVLAESDDDAEWIANPRQRHSVFPLRLDDGDFAVWGEVLKHVAPLMEGKTLLVPAAKQGGLLAGLADLCPAGQGLNVVRLFEQPPRRLRDWGGPEQKARMCQRVDARHPKSALFELIEDYARRAGNDGTAAMRMLRQMLWVN